MKLFLQRLSLYRFAAGKTTTNEELEDMIESGNPAIFTQGVRSLLQIFFTSAHLWDKRGSARLFDFVACECVCAYGHMYVHAFVIPYCVSYMPLFVHYTTNKQQTIMCFMYIKGKELEEGRWHSILFMWPNILEGVGGGGGGCEEKRTIPAIDVDLQGGQHW